MCGRHQVFGGAFGGAEPEATVDAWAIALATEAYRVRDLALRTRLRKRLRCDGCGAVVGDSAAFEAHCGEVDHDEDFTYMCTEIEECEIVASASAD